MPRIIFWRIKFYDYRIGWVTETTEDPWQAQEMKAYRESQGFKVIMQKCIKETVYTA